MIVLLSCFLSALPCCDGPQDPGKLKQFEKPSEKKKSQDKPSKPKSEDDTSSAEDHGGSFAETLFQGCALPILEFAAYWTIEYPFVDNHTRYDRYPFATAGTDYFSEDTSKMAATELELHYSVLSSNLMAYGGGGAVYTPSGFHFSFDVSQYREEVSGRTDLLTFQKYQFNYGPGGDTRNYQWTLGIGIGVMGGVDVNVGPTLQATLLWFPWEQISARASAGAMFFSSTTVGDFEAQVGYHVNRFAILIGFRSLVNSDGSNLTGPTFGVESWF